MMKSFALIIMIVFCVSCGESPLFNHKNEKSNPLGGILPVGSALTFAKARMRFSQDWEQNPHLGENKFFLKIWSVDRGTESGPFEDPQGELFISLWMPAMGHGSVPVIIKKTADGEFEINQVVFIMGGDWEIKFQLKKNGKVYDETVLTYHL